VRWVRQAPSEMWRGVVTGLRGAKWGDVEHVNEKGSSGFRSSRETRGSWVPARLRSTLPYKFMNSFEYTSLTDG
jgi:hypothetical protein